RLLLEEVPGPAAGVPAADTVELLVDGAAHGGFGGRERLGHGGQGDGVVGRAVADGVAGNGLDVQVVGGRRRVPWRAAVGLVVLDVKAGGRGVQLGEFGVVGVGHGSS